MISQERRPKVFICEPLAQHEYCHANADTQNFAIGMSSHADVTLISYGPFSDPLHDIEFIKSYVAAPDAKGEKYAPSRQKQFLDGIRTAIFSAKLAWKLKPDIIIWLNGNSCSVLLASFLSGGIQSQFLLHNSLSFSGSKLGWKFRLYWILDKFFLTLVAKKGWLYTTTEEIRLKLEKNHGIHILINNVIPIGVRVRRLLNKRPFQSRALIFGAITARKNYKCAIEGFIAQKSFNELVLAGVLQDESVSKLISDRNIGARIKIISGYIPERELEELFGSADLAILPHGFENSMASGTLSRALEFGLPIIGPNDGYIMDWFKRYQIGYPYRADDPKSLAESLEKAGSNYRLFYNRFSEGYSILTKERSWNSIAKNFLDCAKTN